MRKSTILQNGLTIVTESVASVRSVALGFWVRTGSRNEFDEVAGISHFLEHAIFKGTTNRNVYDIANELESVGGTLNAFTSQEYTCFHARVLSEHLNIAVNILSDILLNPTFPKAEIEREKEVVLDELRDYQDMPDDVIFEHFDAHIFPNHNLGKPVIGNESSIRQFNSDKLNQYLNENYTPEKIVIVAAGFVEHEQLLNFVDAYFQIKRKTKIIGNIVPENDARRGKYVFQKDISQSHMIYGTRTVSVHDNNRWPLAILNSILSGGMSARLFQNIREKYGVAYSIFSFVNLYEDTGTFGIYCATEKSKSEKAIELIKQELEIIKKQAIPELELQRVKAQYKSGVVMSDESMERRMIRLGRQQMYYHRNFSLDEFMERIEAVTANQVLELAQELFNYDAFLTTILEGENTI
jgi:predicted Zn-dependent peptidase